MSFDAALKRVLDAAVEELTEVAATERNRARQEGTDEGRAQGWEDGREQGRFEGREEATKESRATLEAAVAAAKAETTVVATAHSRVLDAVRAIDEARSLSDILNALTERAGSVANRAGILLVRGDRLHGWKFHGFGASLGDAGSIDVAADDSGIIGAAARRGKIQGDGASVPSPFADPSSDRQTFAVPIALFGEPVAVLYADCKDDDAAKASGWRETLEVLARHAASALEAMTAIKAARSVAGLDARASTDEADDADSSARRYAKLLISEIKLYHEAAVVQGRRERDLATRLGGEISRARVLYEQRVPAAVRDRADYFRDELVRTLANGDATLLRLT